MKRINQIFIRIFFIIVIFTIFSTEDANDIFAKSKVDLTSTVTIKMFRLGQYGENSGIPCGFTLPEIYYGCTYSSSFVYPYEGSQITINIENDYLVDVLSQEMSPEIYPHHTALRAQAIASRSYVQYYINNSPGDFNNSSQYQVFIPYRFESLAPLTIPDNAPQPCASTNLNANQLAVCTAVIPKVYIAQAANNPYFLAAKALFMADRTTETLDATFDKPYLKNVKEPISTICDANNDGPGYGLSQEGAVRWARGNQCARSSEGNSPWSVRWNNESLILFHYFTDVHLIDENQNRLSPADRWNPLQVTSSGYCPPIMDAGQTCTLTFTAQNTGTTTWNGQYAFVTHGWEQSTGFQPIQLFSQEAVLTQFVSPGEDIIFTSTFTAPIPDYPGFRFSLRFEMGLYDEYSGYIGFSELDPERPWQPYDVNICVGGSCKLYLTNLQK